MKNYREVAEDVFRRRDAYEEAKETHRQGLQKAFSVFSIFAIGFAFLFSIGSYYVCAVTLGIVEDRLGICDKFFTVPVSQKQALIVENAAVPLGQTVTSADVSVTAQSAFTDGTTAIVLLRIEAPEHIDLDVSGLGFEVDARGIIRGDKPAKRLGAGNCGWTQHPREDQDGAKNTKDLLLEIDAIGSPDGSFSFADGYDRYLLLDGLYAYRSEYPYSRYLIADGAWYFQIRFDDNFSNVEREMLDAPITMNCSRALYKVQQTATVHSIVAKGLSVTMYYTYGPGAVKEPGDFGYVIKVVLTDGTIIDVESNSGSCGEHGEFISHFLATAPIPVDDIAYMQIGETIIGANQTIYQERELLDAPIGAPCHNFEHNITQTATIHSVMAKGFSVTLRYTFGADATQERGSFGDIKVVLKDGTVVKTREDLCVLADNGEFTATFMASAPILSELIDSIQIGETVVAAKQITHQGNPLIPAP